MKYVRKRFHPRLFINRILHHVYQRHRCLVSNPGPLARHADTLDRSATGAAVVKEGRCLDHLVRPTHLGGGWGLW